MTKPTPIAALAALFGQRRILAAAAGIDPALLPRWEKTATRVRRQGHIPSRYNRPILAAAREAGLDHTTVAAHLDMHTCPLCGGKLAAGAALDPRILRGKNGNTKG